MKLLETISKRVVLRPHYMFKAGMGITVGSKAIGCKCFAIYRLQMRIYVTGFAADRPRYRQPPVATIIDRLIRIRHLQNRLMPPRVSTGVGIFIVLFMRLRLQSC